MIVNLAEAMQIIATIQEGLSVEVEELGSFRVEKAWPFPPSGRNSLPTTPCVINYPRRISLHMANGRRERFFAIRSHLFLAQIGSDLEEWGQVACAFEEAYVDAVGKNHMLGAENVRFHMEDSEDAAEIPTSLPFNGIDHVGLEFLATLQLHDAFEVVP